MSFDLRSLLRRIKIPDNYTGGDQSNKGYLLLVIAAFLPGMNLLKIPWSHVNTTLYREKERFSALTKYLCLYFSNTNITSKSSLINRYIKYTEADCEQKSPARVELSFGVCRMFVACAKLFLVRFF